MEKITIKIKFKKKSQKTQRDAMIFVTHILLHSFSFFHFFILEPAFFDYLEPSVSNF